MGKFRNYLPNLLDGIMKVLVGTGVVCLLAVMLVFVGNIISRSFGKPILGTYEVIRLCMVPVIAFALGYTALKQGHIVIEIVLALFRKRARKIFAAISALLSLFIWALIAWRSTEFAFIKWGRGETTEQLSLPVPLFRMIWAGGLLVLVLVLCFQLVQSLKGQRDR